ncbi:MAG: hypothetical protein ABIN39_03030 [candidate division WOR-3 bacterium]
MEKIILILILLFCLLNSNCNLDYKIIQKTGGSFLVDETKYTIRYYSDQQNNISTIQYTGDTIIEGLKYKRYNFDEKENFFYHSGDFEYKIIFFEGFYFDVSFFPTYLLKDQKIYKTYENNNFKYRYICSVDSVKSFEYKNKVYDSSYFVTINILMSLEQKDTTIVSNYILNFENGIVGFKKDDRFFYLDSVID